jgi:hypothetical protein
MRYNLSQLMRMAEPRGQLQLLNFSLPNHEPLMRQPCPPRN